MDPDANIKEQLDLAQQIIKVWDECLDDGTLTPLQAEMVADLADELAELVVALDGWISRGGYMPRRWRNNK